MARRANTRAADADREHVAERLRQATAEGRLEPEELEDRLEVAFSARTYGELAALTRDLPRDSASRTRRSLPVPWPVAVIGFMILMPIVVAVVIAAVVLVASFVAMWALVALAVIWTFGHRVRFVGPRYCGRAWHAGASRWR